MFHKLWGTGHPWPPTIPLLIISQYSLGEDFSWLTLAVSGVILAFEVGQQKFFFWKGKREKRKIRSLAVSRRGPQERTSVDSAERQSDWHKIHILSHLWCTLYGHYLKIHFCFTTCPYNSDPESQVVNHIGIVFDDCLKLWAQKFYHNIKRSR